MPKLKRKARNPYQDVETVTAAQTFCAQDVTIIRGEKRAGSDPVVAANHGAFLAGDLAEHQLPNPWDALVDVPEHPSHVYIPASVPPHRQVESMVDVWFEGGFAPGSVGAKSGRPAGFGYAIRRGQIFDALQPVVREHPEWFVWVKRPVMHEDLDRLERLERLERPGSA